MQWIRANDRLPENRKQWIVFRQRNNTRSAKTEWLEHAGNNIEGYFKLPLTDLEWLDETESILTVPEDVIKAGDFELTRQKENPNHITKQLSKDEITSYNTGFHSGFLAGHAFKGQQGVGKIICVFCEQFCDPAPTKRGWSSVRHGFGLHFDCAGKVADQGNAMDLLENGEISKEHLPQPTIPLSVIEVLEKANPYNPSHGIDAENKHIGFSKFAYKLRELLQKDLLANQEQQTKKPLAELSDNDALELYGFMAGPSISDQAKIFQVKDYMTTNKFYNTQTNIPGKTWYKIFEFLLSKGYTI